MWHVVYRFDDAAHLDAWERSEERARLLARGAAFMETVAVRRLDGMDAWFAPAPRPGAPPRWKTFLMTAAVIVLLQTLVSTLLRPLVADWPTFVRTAAVIIPVVALMTWLVMPRLSATARRDGSTADLETRPTPSCRRSQALACDLENRAAQRH